MTNNDKQMWTVMSLTRQITSQRGQLTNQTDKEMRQTNEALS